MQTLRETIADEHQAYVDRPVYVHARQVTRIHHACQAMINPRLPLGIAGAGRALSRALSEGKVFGVPAIFCDPIKEIEDVLRLLYAEANHTPSITVGHERVKLRWMTPDGKGGLKPR